MPSLPAETFDKIFTVLEKLPIFDQNGKLKKETNVVWNNAIRDLPAIKKHNLYIYVQQDRKRIQTKLKRHNAIIETSEESIKSNLNSENDDAKSAFQVLDDILSIKNSVSLNAVIKNISSRPFYVLYSSPEQIMLGQNLVNYGSSTFFFLILDVAIENVKIGKNAKPGKVYLHAFGTKVDEETIIIFQFISEVLNDDILAYILRECLRHDFSPPSQLITGYSHRILNTLSKVFNDYSLDQYCSLCYEHLHTCNSFTPPVLIHADVIHVMKVVSTWECNNNQWMKKFVICCLIYISTICSLDLFEVTVINLLALCGSRYESEFTEISRTKLVSALKASEMKELYEKCIRYFNDDCANLIFDHDYYDFTNYSSRVSVNKCLSYVEKLSEQALNQCTKSNEKETNHFKEFNNYYCKETFFKLISLLAYFPVWTNVMRCDNQFCDYVSENGLKHLIGVKEFVKEEKIYAPEFIKKHCEYLKFLCKKGRDYVHEQKKSCKIPQTRKGCDYSHLKYEENWMGKNEFADQDGKQNGELLNGNVERSFNYSNQIDPVSEEIKCNENTSNNLIITEENELNTESNANRDSDTDKRFNSTDQYDSIFDDINKSCKENECNENSIESKIDSSIRTILSDEWIKNKIKNKEKDENLFDKDNTKYDEIDYSIFKRDHNNDSNSSIILDHSYCKQSLNDNFLENRDTVDLDNNTIITASKNVTGDKIVVSSNSLNHGEEVAVKVKHGEKLQNNKKSRLYCDAFPSAGIFYNQACKTIKKKKKEAIIRNAVCLKPLTIKKGTYILEDTSIFDTIMEIMLFTYKTVRSFQNYCNSKIVQKNEINIWKIITTFSKSCNFRNLYSQRLSILLEHGTNVENTIFCKDTAGVFFEKVTNCDFITITKTCKNENCCTISKIKKKIVLLNDACFDVKELELRINNFFNNNKTCLYCLQQNITINCEIDSLFVINLEHLSLEEYLHAIPISITVCTKKCVLIGIVSVKENAMLNETQYIAYCRDLKNVWYEHNDINKHIKRLTYLPRCKIQLLFYVCYE